tara:strand:- start:1946 stop:3085 length:1140 start_codon:yes stop_codon:yes gene_type:complete
MKNFLIVFGTRPEAIKMAPLVKLFKESNSFTSKVCVTAQHREMLDQVLDIFDIKPDYDLNLMKKSQDLYDTTSNVLLGMRDVLVSEKPDFVIVHGDTTTSMCASLSSFYEKIPVCHVEAGLRTNNILSPWPEEINRQLTGRIAEYHFAPTIKSKQNLIEEGICRDKIIVTGNTVIDSLVYTSNKIKNDNKIEKKIEQKLIHLGINLTADRKIILVTGHRRENIGDGFINICRALKFIAQSNEEVDLIYPVHLNPEVQSTVHQILSETKNIYLIKPLDYLPFIYLMQKSYFIITDSGGIQEEAPALGKPVLVTRDTTERPEAIKSGTVKLVGTNYNKIIQESQKLINNQINYNKMSTAHNPYGDGKSSQKIINFFKKQLK